LGEEEKIKFELEINVLVTINPVSQQEHNQKLEELHVASIFTKWLNNKNGSDYICHNDTIPQSLPVDVIAVSKSRKFKDIKIQVTTAEADYEKIRGSKFSAMKKRDEKIEAKPISLNPTEWIMNSLENKRGNNGIRGENKNEINHDIGNYFNLVLGKPTKEEAETIKSLEIAIINGKYHITGEI